jgi:hypothetical protein
LFLFPSLKMALKEMRFNNMTMVKVKFSLEQATEVQRGSKGIALLFL